MQIYNLNRVVSELAGIQITASEYELNTVRCQAVHSLLLNTAGSMFMRSTPRKFGHFQRLSPPSFIMGAGK